MLSFLGQAGRSSSATAVLAEETDSQLQEADLPALLAELHAVLPLQLPREQAQGEWPEDAFLLKCLRQRKGDVPRCCEVVRNFVLFRDRQRWPLKLTLDDVSVYALRGGFHWTSWHSPTGRAVLWYNAHLLQPTEECRVVDYQKMACYLMEQLTDELIVQQEGVVLVFDCRQWSIAMATVFDSEDVRRGVTMWLDCFPAKIRQILVLGLSTAVTAFISAALLALPVKIRRRVRFCGTTTQLCGALGAVHVPEAMGGNMTYSWEELVDRHVHHGESLLGTNCAVHDHATTDGAAEDKVPSRKATVAAAAATATTTTTATTATTATVLPPPPAAAAAPSPKTA